ncbi:MAG TPA: hypothetical protein VD886_00010 [Herpetosiphonaceae bacterium]|nr:hypothetical protein [Herpetosiphonaceae bacterium]
MSDASYPSLQEFLAAPIEEVSKVAPTTMIYSSSGSRRAAALAGVPMKDYPAWSLPRLFDQLAIFLRYGVRHLVVPMLMPSGYRETTPGYRENIEGWVDRGLAGPDTLAHWRRQGWRVRMLGTEAAPGLQAAAARLAAETPPGPPTIWFTIVPEAGLPWEWALAAARASGATTRAEAALALYGEDIPPATLFLSWGKPIVNHDLLPPLLVGDLQCYWYQRPGYSVTDSDFRTILYDYAFTRKTWKEDKTGRDEQALHYRAEFENAPIIGLGRRLGPFWYPQSHAEPDR